MRPYILTRLESPGPVEYVAIGIAGIASLESLQTVTCSLGIKTVGRAGLQVQKVMDTVLPDESGRIFWYRWKAQVQQDPTISKSWVWLDSKGSKKGPECWCTARGSPQWVGRVWGVVPTYNQSDT